MTRDEYAEKLARYEQLMATPLPKAKPKPRPALSLEVSERTAANVRARPEAVRVVTTGEDNATFIDRPRRTELLEVLEVDGQGRPAIARRYDALTGERGIVEFAGGYRRPGDVQHEYDPLAGLSGDR
jgi:hypothetical protein